MFIFSLVNYRKISMGLLKYRHFISVWAVILFAFDKNINSRTDYLPIVKHMVEKWAGIPDGITRFFHKKNYIKKRQIPVVHLSKWVRPSGAPCFAKPLRTLRGTWGSTEHGLSNAKIFYGLRLPVQTFARGEEGVESIDLLTSLTFNFITINSLIIDLWSRAMFRKRRFEISRPAAEKWCACALCAVRAITGSGTFW